MGSRCAATKNHPDRRCRLETQDPPASRRSYVQRIAYGSAVDIVSAGSRGSHAIGNCTRPGAILRTSDSSVTHTKFYPAADHRVPDSFNGAGRGSTGVEEQSTDFGVPIAVARLQ